MRGLHMLTAALAIAGVTSVAGAQNRFTLEATGGASFPVAKIADTELNTGFGFGFNARYRFMPHLAAYAGWEWNKLTADALMAGGTIDVEDTGYTFGMRFEHPLTTRVAYWLRAGGMANHIEFENEDGDIVENTGHGLGWEVGGGLTLPLSDRLQLTPGVRYRSLSRDMGMEFETLRANLRYVTVGTGIVFTF